MRFVFHSSCAAAIAVGVLATACSDATTLDPTVRGDGGGDEDGSGSDRQRDGGGPSGTSTGRGNAGEDGSGISAFGTFALKPDSQCVYGADDNTVFVPVGLYDVSGAIESGSCAAPYVVHLQVAASAGAEAVASGAAPSVLQLHSAEVRLMTIREETISFDRGSPPLPNPFLIVVNASLLLADDGSSERGLIAVEAIPRAYAEQLDGFVGGQILAELQVFGTTTTDVDVAFEPFVYPIELCAGCLSICETQLDAMGQTREEVIGDQCDDNAAADGRICIDPEC